MTIRAVAFDLDYTLAVPERDRATLLSEALAAAGGDGVADALSRADYVDAHTEHAASETREPIFAALLDGHDADPRVAAETYRTGLADTLEAVGGADALLSTLREEYALGLLTDGPSRAQRDKLDALGWTDRFDAVVVTGELGTRKPDRATFTALLDALDVAPEETVYVGDNIERDIGGAAAAGLRTVQVLGDGEDPAGRAPTEPDDRADAHVRRSDLAGVLPQVLEALD